MLVLAAIIVAVPAPITLLAGGAGSIIATTGVVGLPVIYAILGLILLVSAIAWAAVSRLIPDSNGLYTFAGRGLGVSAGYGVAALGVVAYNAMTIANIGLVSEELTGPLQDAGLSVKWWMLALPVVLLVGALGTCSFRIRVIALVSVLCVQVPAILLFDFTALLDPGPQGVSTTALGPSSVFSGSIGAAIGFLALTYVGIEAAIVFRGESKASVGTVSRATYLGVAALVVLYVTSTWLVTVIAGPDSVVTLTQHNAIDLVPDALAARLGGWVSNVFVAIEGISTIGAALAFHSLAARHFRATAEDGLLPRRLERPIAGSLLQTSISAVAVIAFAIGGGDPYRQIFLVMSHLGALSAVLMLVVVFFAIAVFFLRTDSGDDGFFGWEGVLIAALAAGVALLVMLGLTLSQSSERLGVRAGSALIWLLPLLVVAAFVGGVVRALIARESRPEAVARLTGRRSKSAAPEFNYTAAYGDATPEPSAMSPSEAGSPGASSSGLGSPGLSSPGLSSPGVGSPGVANHVAPPRF